MDNESYKLIRLLLCGLFAVIIIAQLWSWHFEVTAVKAGYSQTVPPGRQAAIWVRP